MSKDWIAFQIEPSPGHLSVMSSDEVRRYRARLKKTERVLLDTERLFVYVFLGATRAYIHKSLLDEDRP
jgi:hypothetical protein